MGLLDGKVALITGGGEGVGQGCAVALAREGVAIVVTGRKETTLRETVAMIEDAGGRASFLVADVMKPENCPRTIDHVIETFGGLDILINNAVSNIYLGPLLEANEDQLQESLDVGPLACFRYMNAVHPHMKARGGGVILNMITGTANRWDQRFFGIYIAGKQATRSLSRAAAGEWGVDNIRVICVAPVSESPSMTEWQKTMPEAAAEFVKAVPMGRLGNPVTDIGGGIVALCLPQSQYITGCVVAIDGGQCFFN